MKSKTINLWDKMVENAPDSFKEYFKEEEKFIKRHILKEHKVLDLGCGTGRTIKTISPICKEIIGIDNDKEAVERGKENIKNLENSKIILEDAEKTSFEDNSFDIVFGGLTFVNFGKTKFNVLKEIKRILKTNGKFIFSVYNEDSLKERLKVYKKYESRNINLDKSGDVAFDSEAVSEKFSKEEITEILSKAGFKVGEIIKGQIFYLIEATI